MPRDARGAALPAVIRGTTSNFRFMTLPVHVNDDQRLSAELRQAVHIRAVVLRVLQPHATPVQSILVLDPPLFNKVTPACFGRAGSLLEQWARLSAELRQAMHVADVVLRFLQPGRLARVLPVASDPRAPLPQLGAAEGEASSSGNGAAVMQAVNRWVGMDCLVSVPHVAINACWQLGV